MHGLGADGHDFEPIVNELRLPFSVRFVFPHAPTRPVTLNGGMRMRAWYDLRALTGGVQEDGAGIRASTVAVRELIDREVSRGVDPRRIVLAGFSQGGALALYAALREVRGLGGVLALSTYLPLPDTLAEEATEANQKIPIFMAHGDNDAVIPQVIAAASRDRLIAANYEVAWRAYPMEHSVCSAEVRDIADWLSGLFVMG
jgi:phospholipase/carboxylesterase